MKLKWHFILLFSFCVIVSGCSPKLAPPAEIRDSVRVEFVERPVYDTLKVEVPVEVEKVVTLSDSSHLETTFAVSEAVVRDGMLFHSISNKPQTWIKPVQLTIRDKVTTTSHIERQPPQIIEVEKQLTWWQKTQLAGFKIMIFLILASLAIKYRKSIISLAKLIWK